LPSADAALRTVGKAANAAGAAASGATRRAAGAAQEAGKSIATRLLPVGILLLAALAAWYYFGRGSTASNVAQNAANSTVNAASSTVNAANSTVNAAKDAVKRASDKVTVMRPELPSMPEVPDITTIGKDVSGIFTSATQTLNDIRDAASAQAALPKLTELSGKLDGIRDQFTKLPATGQSALGQLVGKQFASLQELVKKTLAMPGLNDQVKEVLVATTSKLAGLNLGQVSP
jgi:hypothetical protein